MLSPQSNLRSYVASAENQISVLRNRGLNDDADMFESSIRAAIQSKDPSIMSSLKGLDDIYQANLKSAPKEKGPEMPSNLAQSIVDIMQMSEARNIALNPASIRDAATAMQSGDENAMERIYSEFSNDYKSRLEQQDKEKKTLQTLADGTSVLIGETTGTRYTTSGLPISPDAINTNVFNMSVFDKVADPNVQQAMTIPSDTGVAFNREVYQAAPMASDGQFRQATPGQAAAYGAPAGQFGPDGRFYPLYPPAGMSVKTSPDGSVELIQGSGVGMSKQQAAAEAAKKQSFERTRSITGAAAGIITPIQESLSQGAVGARIDQAVSAWLPASQQGRIAADLETIRVQTSKEEIGNMRASSPTGSAGGQITEREWPKFENRFGKLEVGLNAKDLTRNLQLTVLNQFEATNGTPEDVVKLLDDGKISQATFDNYVDEYKNTRSALGIPNTGVEGRLYGWTKFDNRLMQKYSKAGQVFSSPEAEAIRARMQSLQSR